MIQNHKNTSLSGPILMLILLVNAVVLEHAFTANADWYWALLITVPPLLATVVYNPIYNRLNKSRGIFENNKQSLPAFFKNKPRYKYKLNRQDY